MTNALTRKDFLKTGVSALAILSLSACTKGKTPEDTIADLDLSTPKLTLEEFFTRLASLDLDEMEKANQKLEKALADQSKDAVMQYGNPIEAIESMPPSAQRDIWTILSEAETACHLFSLDGMKDSEKAFLAVLTSTSSTVLTNQAGSDAKASVDESLISEDGDSAEFKAINVSISSETAQPAEMQQTIAATIPGALKLKKSGERWMLDGKSFVDDQLAVLTNQFSQDG